MSKKTKKILIKKLAKHREREGSTERSSFYSKLKGSCSQKKSLAILAGLFFRSVVILQSHQNEHSLGVRQNHRTFLQRLDSS
jgi:hypothetical protein